MRIDLVHGRPLNEDDVETAHRLLDQHLPGPADRAGRARCSSATHLITAPSWPCQQHHWATAVLAAEARGEIASTGARVLRLPA